MSLPNRYFICLSYEKEPIPWDLGDEEQRNAPVYYREVLREVEQRVPDRGLTFTLHRSWTYFHPMGRAWLHS